MIGVAGLHSNRFSGLDMVDLDCPRTWSVSCGGECMMAY